MFIVICIWNPTDASTIKILKNQEIVTYHINDVVMNIATGGNYDGSDRADDDALTSMIYDDWYTEEKKGDLFGVSEGRNLFVIQIESLQNFVLNEFYEGQEITPFLNDLLDDKGTIYFDNYYQENGSGNTSDAEFAVNNAIVGSNTSYTYKLFADNTFRGLPVHLKDRGYETAVFHGFRDKHFWNREEFYPAEGFDEFIGGTTLTGGYYDENETIGMGLPDEDFFDQTVDYIATELAQPFYSFIITLTNHHPFQMTNGDYRITLNEEHLNTLPGDYLNTVAYTDYALELFIERLKEEGLYENSVIVMYGDHQGITMDDEHKRDFQSVIGEEYRYDTMMNVPLIVHIPGTETNRMVNTAGGHIDVFPTLAYLFGFEELDTLYLGHNMLTVDEGFVGQQTYIPKGSFFTDNIAYEMSMDGVFEHGKAWSTEDGSSVELTDDLYDGYWRSINLMAASEKILSEDLIREFRLYD